MCYKIVKSAWNRCFFSVKSGFTEKWFADQKRKIGGLSSNIGKQQDDPPGGRGRGSRTIPPEAEAEAAGRSPGGRGRGSRTIPPEAEAEAGDDPPEAEAEAGDDPPEAEAEAGDDPRKQRQRRGTIPRRQRQRRGTIPGGRGRGGGSMAPGESRRPGSWLLTPVRSEKRKKGPEGPSADRHQSLSATVCVSVLILLA